MKYGIKKSSRSLVSAMTAFAFVLSACDSSTLSRLEKVPPRPIVFETKTETAVLNADFCVPAPVVKREKTKFLFIVDKSDSNTDDPSDFDGTVRYGSIKAFVNDPANTSSVSYAYIRFGDVALVEPAGSGFRSDKNAFLSTMTTEQQSPGGMGFTNYKSAIQEATTLSEAAAQNATEPFALIAFFLSDGKPIVRDPGGGPPMLQPQAEVNALVRNFMQLGSAYPDKISYIAFHVGYYNRAVNDPAAREYMNNMSVEARLRGASKFIEFPEGQTIEFEGFAIPKTESRFKLTQAVASDVNAQWAANGEMELDSDGDSLIDKLEEQLGSNPLLADSDGNGLTDAQEVALYGKPCNDAACGKANRAEPNCGDLVESNQNGVKIMKDPDKDGLNSCFERLANGDPAFFSSNASMIPDGTLFRRGLPFARGINALSQDPDNDGRTNYRELLEFTPIYIDDKQIKNILPYKYDLQTVGKETEGCFHLKVTNIPMVIEGNGKDPRDMMRLELVFSASGAQQEHRYQYGEKAIGPNNKVDFASSDYR